MVSLMLGFTVKMTFINVFFIVSIAIKYLPIRIEGNFYGDAFNFLAQFFVGR